MRGVCARLSAARLRWRGSTLPCAIISGALRHCGTRLCLLLACIRCWRPRLAMWGVRWHALMINGIVNTTITDPQIWEQQIQKFMLERREAFW